jgi:beta-1,4-mannosyl-glycoprotein beta-1,4-N-acetylglucosaminyltransferase
LIELPSDYDALFIGNGCNAHVAPSNLCENKHIYKRNLYYTQGILADNGLTRCADSYIISKKCCIKLYDYINNLQNKINESIDAWLEIALMKNNCNVYWAEPTIVTQGSQNGEFSRSWYVLDNTNDKFQNFIKYLQKIENSTFLKNIIIKDVSNISDSLRFYYGTKEHQIDITYNVMKKCIIDNEIFIPGHCNERDTLFTDPMFGVIKNVFVVNNNNTYCILPDNTYTCINLSNKNNSYCCDSIEPNLLTCYKSPYEKIRVGKDFDGGYVICNIPDIKYDFLLSCGVSDDISFEEVFCNIYKNTKCIAYDGTIPGINISNQNITFVKKNINTFNDNNNTNLHSDIENNNNIFLKMDIEGYEIPWINTLSYKQLDKFSQIVIEFHFPFSYKEVPIFNKLNKSHVLVHFHANNCCGVRRHKGILMPNVFECTYIHKKYYISEYLLNDEEIPSSLDMQNVRENSEIYLNYEPFVFKNKNIDRLSLSNDNNNNYKKNYCFIHSCNLENVGTGRLEYLIKRIEESNCINILEKIYIINIGIPIENNYGEKYILTNYSNDPHLYEAPTINKIVDFSYNNNDCNILYIHTKGIRYNVMDEKENDWIDLMLYFLLDNHKECIAKLNEQYDTVGCNYWCDEKTGIPPHFSGNFWWANTNYLKKNQKINESLKDRQVAEFWLFKSGPLYHTIFNSHINHYLLPYPKKLYERTNKIIDCFIFYNELDLLTYRLNLLDKVVDYFVLVESTHTFVGKEKPLFYQENKHLFEKFNDKIIHIIVDDFPHKHPNIDFKKNEQWNNEKFQRNCISRGIAKLNLNSKDIITILDLDEIPNPNILTQIKTNDIAVSINILQMDFYYYNLNSKMDHKWNLSKILTFEKYNQLNIDCENIRFYTCPIINNGGWHLSYFGDNNFIKNKIENFSHQELNLELFTNQEKIQNRIKNKQDLFDRNIKIYDINIEDNDNLPPYYDVYLKNYYTNDIKSILINYSNSRDNTCKFKNYEDYINWQTKIGLSFEKDNNTWMNGQKKCVGENFNFMDRNIKILDICCGDGQGLQKFKEMGFNNVYGVEVCKDKINFAKQYGYTIYECDICCGPFEIGDNYDCIYSSHTIEHVLNPEYTIRNIMSKLKDNGIFILILPYPDYGAADPLDEHRFKIHCGVIPLGLHMNDKGYTICNTIQKMGYKIINYKFESYREPEIQLIITK